MKKYTKNTAYAVKHLPDNVTLSVTYHDSLEPTIEVSKNSQIMRIWQRDQEITKEEFDEIYKETEERINNFKNM